jgi:ATP synthase protein I
MSLTNELIEKLGNVPIQLKKMLIRQIVVASTLFFLSAYLYAINTAFSLLIGFASVLLGVIISTPLASLNKVGLKATAVLINILKAELVKLGVIIISLWLAFKYYFDLQPFALILGLVISALMSGLAISRLDKNN